MYLQKTSPSGDLVKQEELLYALSKQFSILNDGELYDVLRVMRRIGELVAQE